MCVNELNQFVIDRCQKTPPGVNRILVTLSLWLNTLPALATYVPGTNDPLTIEDDITLDTVTYTDAKWVEWQSTTEKAGKVGELQGDPGASYYSSTLSAFMPGQSPLLAYVLDTAVDAELVVLYQIGGKHWRLLGDQNTPAYVKFKDDTGKARGDAVGYEVDLTVPLHDDAFPYYTGAIPI